MDKFREFLQLSKEFSSNVADVPIHVILGNETCDLDSMVSAFALGFVRYQLELQTDSNTRNVFVPILNIPKQEFVLRTENRYLCKKLGIDEKHFTFRTDLDLKQLQQNGLLSVSLVDHHVLPLSDQFLAASVVEIFDHRPRDLSVLWDQAKVKLTLEEVGSCTTLVTRHILQRNIELPQTLALLLYDVIIFDTIAFNPEAKKFKELDRTTANTLKEKFCFESDPQQVFDELWTAHNDISGLTPKELLYKDVKIVNGLPIPVVPLTVKEFLKLPNIMEHIREFCKEKCSSEVVIIGLHVSGNKVERDMAIYEVNDRKIVTSAIFDCLKDAPTSKGYDFGLEEVSLDINNITYFIQKNVKLTRKQILPLIKEALIRSRQED